jgi:hypothetical protein
MTNNETASRYLAQLLRHGRVGAAASEAGISTHTIRAMRRRDPMFDQGVQYCAWRGRGFCDLTAASAVRDIAAVKRYLTELGIKG